MKDFSGSRSVARVSLDVERLHQSRTIYQPDIIYKGVKLWESDSGVNRTYFLSIIEEQDCMSEKTQRSAMGNRIINLVLNEGKDWR